MVHQPEMPQLNSWLGSCGEGMADILYITCCCASSRFHSLEVVEDVFFSGSIKYCSSSVVITPCLQEETGQ